MTFSVRYIGDQAFRLTQFFTDDFYDIDVFHLIVTTDVIYFADTTVVDDQVDRFAV